MIIIISMKVSVKRVDWHSSLKSSIFLAILFAFFMPPLFSLLKVFCERSSVESQWRLLNQWCSFGRYIPPDDHSETFRCNVFSFCVLCCRFFHWRKSLLCWELPSFRLSVTLGLRPHGGRKRCRVLCGGILALKASTSGVLGSVVSKAPSFNLPSDRSRAPMLWACPSLFEISALFFMQIPRWIGAPTKAVTYTLNSLTPNFYFIHKCTSAISALVPVLASAGDLSGPCLIFQQRRRINSVHLLCRQHRLDGPVVQRHHSSSLCNGLCHG